MNQTLFLTVLACWIPASAVLFRLKGPRLAVPIALFAGFLLLPRGTAEGFVPHVGTWINKRTASGLALLVGILVSDRRTLLNARPRLLDLPMIAFVLLPLASFAANGFAGPWDGLGQVWGNFAAWSLPYLAGRLYFGDADGPSRLTTAIIVAGLLSLPIFAFEMVLGPRYYVAGLVYGQEPHQHMVSRLGGWRPEGFQTSGLEVATWLALSATMASWSWLRGGWPSRPKVAWLPPSALILATIAVRGVYGYANLALGLTTAGFTHLARSRALMIALACVPLLYIGSRMGGAWDGRSLVDLARFTGRAGTIEYRFRAERAYLDKVFEHGPMLGFGGINSAIYDFYAQNHLWPDGWWIHELRSGGLVGLSIAILALFLFPVGLALALPVDRSGRASPAAMAWGLALFLLLHLIDSLQNMNYLTATSLIGGSLVGLFSNRRTIRLLSTTRPEGLGAGRRPTPIPLVVSVILLIAIEILGRWPRTSPPPPTPPAPQGPSVKHLP